MIKDEGQMFNLPSTFLIMGEYDLLPTPRCLSFSFERMLVSVIEHNSDKM